MSMIQVIRNRPAVAGALIAFQGVAALAAGPADLVAHEWGTFTSLQGSNGKVIEGLQHEEEGLPSFVYSRNRVYPDDARPLAQMSLASASFAIDPPDDTQTRPQPQPQPQPWPRPRPCVHCKGMENLIENNRMASVTQLETPVIYFCTAHPQRVNVNVEFPQGVISQWYPNAESFRPNIGESAQLSGGSMSWNVDLVGNPLVLPAVSEQDIWARCATSTRATCMWEARTSASSSIAASAISTCPSKRRRALTAE